MKKILLFIAVITFISYPQWLLVNTGLGSLNIVGLGAVGSTLIAATAEQGLFVSTDYGISWQPHPSNNAFPNLNITYAQGDVVAYQGMTVMGHGFLAGIIDTSMLVIPIQGIPNNILTAYESEHGEDGIPEVEFFGTAGGGVFWADNLNSTNWTEISGLPSGDSKYITGLYVGLDSDDNEYLIVGTRNGAFISSAPNSIQSLSAFNTGLSGDALDINKLFGNFALTKNGVYRADDDGNLLAGWVPFIPFGDFRCMGFDFFNQKMLFFGNNIGLSLGPSGIEPIDLTGISGIITSCLVYYSPTEASGFMYIGIQGGGIYRKPLSTTSVQDKELLVNDFKLEQNYPNPFNPVTNISYSLKNDGFVSLKVYNSLGKEIETLVEGYKNSGSYTISFDASKYSSGTYFYTLRYNNIIQTKKMILMK